MVVVRFFLSRNKSHRAIERIGPTSKSMWETIKRQKRTKGSTSVDLVMSFGHRKLNVDVTSDFDYDSDHSQKLVQKKLLRDHPKNTMKGRIQKKRRDVKIMKKSYEGNAEKILKKLYNNEKSTVYHVISEGHACAMRKALSVLKDQGRYVWEAFLCDDDNILTWPTINFLAIELFKNVPLQPKDKEIERNKFLPENVAWPTK